MGFDRRCVSSARRLPRRAACARTQEARRATGGDRPRGRFLAGAPRARGSMTRRSRRRGTRPSPATRALPLRSRSMDSPRTGSGPVSRARTRSRARSRACAAGARSAASLPLTSRRPDAPRQRPIARHLAAGLCDHRAVGHVPHGAQVRRGAGRCLSNQPRTGPGRKSGIGGPAGPVDESKRPHRTLWQGGALQAPCCGRRRHPGPGGL